MAPKKAKVIEKFYGKFNGGDLVLAKMSGYPPWPAFICKYKDVPSKVINKRKQKQIPVIYVDEGTYGWVKEKDVTLLTEDVLKSHLRDLRRKKGDPRLEKCYEQVSDGYTYEDFKKELEEGGDDEEDDNDEDEDQQDEEEEEEAEEEEEEEEENKNIDNSVEVTKNGKVDSEYQNSKTNSDSSIPETESYPDTTANSSDVKSESKYEIETSNISNVPDTKRRKVKREPFEDEEHEIAWKFRYHLQKGLIQRKTKVTEKDLADAAEQMAKLEEFDSEKRVTLNVLKTSKLHKVLREIYKKEELDSMPHKLRERSKTLLSKWLPMIDELKKDKNGHTKTHDRELSEVK